MSEILISHPEVNQDFQRNYSYRDGWARDMMPVVLRELGISPASHPNAIELFAGDGSWARMLVDNGWNEESLTCIDMRKSPTPLVPKADWLYWDLSQLARALLEHSDLPPEAASLQGKFNLVYSFYGDQSMAAEDALGSFFVSPGGIVFNQCTEPGEKYFPYLSAS